MVGDNGDYVLKDGKKSGFLAPVLERLDLGEKDLYLSGLWGSSRAYFLASLFKERNRSFLIVTPDLEEAQSLQSDLRFFLGDSQRERVYLFPSWEVLPYEPMSPTTEITARRMEVLFLQQERKTMLVVAPIQALMEPVLPPDILSSSSEIVETGEEIERDRLIDKLQSGGYRSVDMVENMGEYSVRGGILDFFGPLKADPIRIEFFGDQIDSIRTFDYSTQRTKTFLEELIIIPARAIILNEQTISSLKQHLASEHEEGKELLEKVGEGILFPGIEQYLTYFYQQQLGLIDYMEGAWVFLDESYFVHEKAEHHQKIILEEFRKERNPLYPPPEAAFFSPETIFKKLKREQLFYIDSLKISKTTRPYLPFHIAQNRVKGTLAVKSKEGLFTALAEQIHFWLDKGYRLILTANSHGQAERLKEILFDEGIVASIEEKGVMERAGVSICIGDLDTGFAVTDEQLCLITEKDIFGKQKVPVQSKRYKSSRFLSTLSDLLIYDLVVHVDHGIGCYMGLTKVMVEERPVDFFIIEYEGGDRLLVPLDRLYLVQKYMGARGEHVRIDKLGGKSWARVKENVKASLKQMAEELLQLYATREVVSGFNSAPDSQWQKELEDSFEYEETPDQMTAINDVKQDMESEKPMDRLICGDVGYGKTEVAVRGAFKAVMSGKQVAILVPTTILAQQHYQTFSRRFKPYPIEVDVLSRFRTAAEKKKIREGISSGEIDVIIGTHGLLQKSISFKNLGLLVVDEEQHFGVAHKEKIKTLRKEVDVLTMTATPIPRTLQMALTGVRDLSIIDTAPEDRQNIHTEITTFDDNIIRDGVLRELERDGQIFFVHNRVETIERMADHLRRLVPEAKTMVAHGKMREHVLEEIMLRFLNRDYDMLVCTTIIESGLDMPSVNTIFINRADTLGLAQLYQLRGRVGRSKHRAYAYLLIRSEKLLTDQAKKRLRAIEELSELGAGFRLAAHDLEIRGGGNILGEQQHGQIAAIGFDLYCQLLDTAISELKGEAVISPVNPIIDLALDARFAEHYIPDTNQRLVLYKKVSAAESIEELEGVEKEIVDRFGRLPDSARRLLEVMKINVLCKRLRILELKRNKHAIQLKFDEKTPLDTNKLIVWVKERDYRLLPDNALTFNLTHEENDRICLDIYKILEQLDTFSAH